MSTELSQFLERINERELAFYCRGCKMMHPVPIAPDPENPKAPKWQFNGDVNRPSFHPSVIARHTRSGKVVHCHSWIKNDTIEYMGDCTHELKGQTNALPTRDMIPTIAEEQQIVEFYSK